MADDQVQKIRTFTGWKLDIERAVRADRKVSAGAASCFAAFMDHVNAETRKAWPSEGMLAIALGTSRPTVRKYLKQLIDAKWMRANGKSVRGTTVYEITDSRMNIVLDQVAIEIDRFRETEKARQSARREKRASVCKHGFTPTESVSVNTGCALSVNTGLHEHLHGTPSVFISREKEDLALGFPCGTSAGEPNAYADAKGGEEHIPFPVPDSEAEADEIIAGICEGRTVHPDITDRMKRFLKGGVLTPNMANNIIGPGSEEAA